MAIAQGLCNTFKQEILVGTHNLTAGQHAIVFAMYSSSALLSAGTAGYTSGGEVASSGSYSTGGGTLTNVTPALSGSTALCDFSDISFTSATITARGALMYNHGASDKAVAVLDFGADKTSTAGTFAIVFPTADASNAIIRIT
jgi:hypothetical protein